MKGNMRENLIDTSQITSGTGLKVHYELEGTPLMDKDGRLVASETAKVLGSRVGRLGSEKVFIVALGQKHVLEIPEASMREGIYGCVVVDYVVEPRPIARDVRDLIIINP